MPGNPLVTETLRGLTFTGRPHRDYLLCLVAQALAVLLWWPKSDNIVIGTPVTLFAALIALGITLAYHNVRLGAEETTFPHQQSLREWLLSTTVPVKQLLLGYVVSHILQTLHWLLLSTPVLLIAWSVTGNSWQSLCYSVFSLILLASFYRVAGSCVYLGLGHYKALTRYGVRGIVLVTYVMLGLVFPASSHWRLTDELLSLSSSGGGSTTVVGFVLFYGTCTVLLVCGLGILSWRMRAANTRSDRLE